MYDCSSQNQKSSGRKLCGMNCGFLSQDDKEDHSIMIQREQSFIVSKAS